MPVLLDLDFFACRDDFSPKNARLKAGMAALKGRSTLTAHLRLAALWWLGAEGFG
jgi:hypothetical protein